MTSSLCYTAVIQDNDRRPVPILNEFSVPKFTQFLEISLSVLKKFVERISRNCYRSSFNLKFYASSTHSENLCCSFKQQHKIYYDKVGNSRFLLNYNVLSRV